MPSPAPTLPAGRPWRRRRLLATAYLLVAAGFFGAGFLLRPGLEEGGPAALASVERIRLPRPVPVAAFSLEEVGANVNSAPYTRDRLLNRWTLMYFGYTHCPDICRPALAAMAQAARDLRVAGADGSGRREAIDPQLVFVSLDGARDTAAAIHDFLAGTGADIVGLRGSEKQITELAGPLGILHSRRPADAQGRYLVDHPAAILLIDPRARLRAGFSMPRDAARIVEIGSAIAADYRATR